MDAPAPSSSGPEKCSFCDKLQTQVRRLIAGPGVFICDKCVALCADIIGEEFADAPDPSAPVVLPREEAMAIRWHLAETLDRQRVNVGTAADLLKRLDRALRPVE